MRLNLTIAGICVAIATTGVGAAAQTVVGVSGVDPARFVVAESFPLHGDSFVITLTDPADIGHARDLIARGFEAGRPIVFARIAEGADGVNRDVSAPGEPLWSWQVVEVLGFTDISAEIYDGWPMFVEQDIAGWMQNTQGFIGFWNYTVRAEIPVAPPRCACERDGATGVDIGDLLAYLSMWFDRLPEANLDHRVEIDVFDLLAYLECWFEASDGGRCP